MFKNTFFFFENHTVYEIRWKNFAERSKPQLRVWRMRIACSINKSTNTHLGCVILITFPLQQWLHERASLLRYKYIACLVIFIVGCQCGVILSDCVIHKHWSMKYRNTKLHYKNSSRLLSKNLKIKIYRTIILLVFLYGCVT